MWSGYIGRQTFRHVDIECNDCARRRYFLNEQPFYQNKINKVVDVENIGMKPTSKFHIVDC